MIRTAILWILAVLIVLGGLGYIAFQISPWPSALIIRRAFDKDATKVSKALEKHLPTNVSASLDVRYDEQDRSALLDVFYPSEVANTERALPTIIWVHGGAWISGSKNSIANYLRILAGHGYTVVGVDYSIAPGAIYPTPLRQVNAALGFLAREGQELHVDASRLVLAGDSAGSQIAAQIANIVTAPSYAEAVGIVPSIKPEQLKGVLLQCGAYDVSLANLDGPFGNFLRTVFWSYSGRRDFKDDPVFATASVAEHVTSAFPPVFISAGNADPLAPQSVAFAKALTEKAVPVDQLFFPNDYTPALPHEYQFNLDIDAGRLALDRSLAFVGRIVSAAN